LAVFALLSFLRPQRVYCNVSKCLKVALEDKKSEQIALNGLIHNEPPGLL
jgi:hypothetical protein